MYPAIPVIRTLSPKQKPTDESTLGFGQIFTDHMFSMDYVEGQGWMNARIHPYEPILLDPAAMVLHYGQAIFEGMKAYRGPKNEIRLFRPEQNFKRANLSNQRMSIPQIDEAFALHALKSLLRVEADWVPSSAGSSLYIRPFIIATDAVLGVRASNTYRFMIILSPSGAYYKEGLNPVSIRVEDEYVRAVRGGTGYAKTPGNYAASLAAQSKAQKGGYSQVLWLDGVERRYVEEVGAMNIMFVRNNTVYTPSLTGSILPGITRATVIETLRFWGYTVEERPVAIDEIETWAKAGELSECFGTGTAAVISPVGCLSIGEVDYQFNGGKIGELSQKLYDYLTGVQFGLVEDEHQWIQFID